jgi:hypothetical protein
LIGDKDLLDMKIELRYLQKVRAKTLFVAFLANNHGVITAAQQVRGHPGVTAWASIQNGIA